MSTIDDIADLKDRVERIEQFILSVFPAAAGGAPTASPEEEPSDLYELTSFNVRKSESSIGPEYSYRIGVKNKSGSAIRLYGEIVFNDRDDFVVCTAPVGIFTVPAKSDFVKTGQTTITEDSHIARIADVTAELKPL